MTKVWYQNPEILLNDLDEFIPNKKLSKLKNINSIARFAIYLSLIILILKQNTKWLLISLLLLFISYYLNISNNNKDINNNILNKPTIPINNIQQLPETNNYKTTIDNPYMNYITNNSILHNPNSFSQLLPKNISINSDPTISLNLFSKDNTPLQSMTSQSNPIQNNDLLQSNNTQSNNTQSNDLLQSNNTQSNNTQSNNLLQSNNTQSNNTQSNNTQSNDLLQSNNTINYDLCLTSNSNKSCSPNNNIEELNNLPDKFKINNELKREIRKNYRSHLKFDSIDMWGQLINDRNYYTSANINIINDQTEFAKWCFTNNGGSGKCKTDGSDCVKDRDIRYYKDKISINNK